MNDRENVMWSLARCSCGVPDACSDCNYNNYPPRICVQHLTGDALALLKAQEPRVMTWQDVIGAVIECKPIYIEVKDSEDKERGDDRWAMVTQYKDSITNGMIRAMSTYITSEILFVEWYGITWRCWTSRPDEKRMAETPWE